MLATVVALSQPGGLTRGVGHAQTGQTGQTFLGVGMPRTWQMQNAKAKFAELIRRARLEGPQFVTHRGVETAVVVSVEDYRRLDASRPSFVEHLLAGPKLDDAAISLINKRSADTGRDIDL